MLNLSIIKSLLKDKKITINQFAESLNMSTQGFQKLIRENSTKIETLEQIALLLNVPISVFFENEQKNDIKPASNVEFLNIPFLPIHAQAGYGRGYGDQEYIESLPTYPVIADKNYKGKYRVFEVEGDSMDDGTRNAIFNGDKVLCREVKRDLWTSKLHYKDWYFVICMKNDGITIKQITEHDVEKGVIHCHPLNPIFDDFEVDLNEVAELYNVIKIVERNARL